MNVEAARVTYVDSDGRPVGEPVVVAGAAVIETWERNPDGGLVRLFTHVRPGVSSTS